MTLNLAQTSVVKSQPSVVYSASGITYSRETLSVTVLRWTLIWLHKLASSTPCQQ